MMKPFYSIIIPTFNSANTLAVCVDSILSQTNQNFEIIFVDGDSKDETLSIIKMFESLPYQIKWVSEKDQGIYDAMNKGIAMASGEWLYFLGSDDRLYANKVLDNISNHIKKSSATFFYGNVLIEGSGIWAKDGQVYNGEYNIEKILKSNICHQAIFYSRQAVKENNGYNKKYNICADWDLNLKFFSKEKVQYCDEIIAIFNAAGASSVKAADEFLDHDYVLNVSKYFNWTPFSTHFRSWRYLIKRNAKTFYKNGRIVNAIKFMAAYLFHSVKSI